MLAIWKREVQNYFYTPIGYVFMGVFLAVSGFFFFFANISSGSASLTTMFSNLTYVFMLLVPILTMRLLSEEKRTKTDQMLITSPASISDIVMGKFFAACSVLLASMAVTLFYVVVIAVYSEANWGLIFVNYLGFFMMGACYIAIGVLMSSLTENQLSAAMLTFGANLLLQLAESTIPQLTLPAGFGFITTAASWLSLYKRFSTFTAGMLSVADILYFASFCGIALFLTARVIDKRRWSEG